MRLPVRIYSQLAVPGPIGRRCLGFTSQEWIRLGGLYGVVALLHVIGWGLYLHFAARYSVLIGFGLVAYMFGLRHAFDADHIAAIDDTVRWMRQKGRSEER